jgi:hypothetical protein
MNDEPGDDHRLCRFGGVFSSAPMRQVFSDENRIAQYLAVEAALRAIDRPAIRPATTRPKLMFCGIGSDMPGAPVGIPN